MSKKTFIIITVILGLLGLNSRGLSLEINAVVTEVKRGLGAAEVKYAKSSAWEQVTPLQSLAYGDEIRALNGASVVILFPQGGQAIKITEANSPYIIQPSGEAKKSQKVEMALKRIIDFLAGKKKVEISQPLAVRAAPVALAIVSPRNTNILMGEPPLFEWIGVPRGSYALRIFEDNRLVWQQMGLYDRERSYPPDAPPLMPGKRYLIEVETIGQPVASAWFTIATAQQTDELTRELLARNVDSYTGSTRAIIKSVTLIEEGFFYDARKVLLEAISKDNDEPSLFLMLGKLYEQSGIEWLAAEAYSKVDFLTSGQ